VTPSTRPTTRLTSAFVRDRGFRPIIVTVVGSLLELRAKGLRTTETVDIASVYGMAVKARVTRERAQRHADRKRQR
jgi:hypothetical protein